MAKKLQKQGHREVDYNRPNRQWICGHSDCGKECPLGPSGSGGCRGSGECLPIKNGDRWFCTRPQSQGGECSSGPGPEGVCGCPLAKCQPIRTHRHLRKLAVAGAGILTLGFVLITLFGNQSSGAAHPGKLSIAHGGANLSCDSCHSEGSLSTLSSLGDPDFIHTRALADSKLCLDCHQGEIGEWEGSARFAHGWNEAQRTALVSTDKETGSLGETPLMLWLASKSNIRQEGLNGEMSCATCHQEHHGADASLTKLSNNQCQVCHQDQFHGFDKGHPTFAETDYPYSRRTRIYFDHESHYGSHFDKKVKFIEGYESAWPPSSGGSCQECHETDSQGEYMKLKGYETTCAKCHDDKFVRDGSRITLLAIPQIESEKVAGNWPVSRHGLVPLTRLLLTAETREYLRNLKSDESVSNDRIAEEEGFGELWLDDDSRREAADMVAADLQNLLHEVWADGSEVLGERLVESGFLSSGEQTAAISGIPAASFRQLLFPSKPGSLEDIAFPALDLKTLNQKLGERKNRSIGLWPKASGNLTPLMLELLSHRHLDYALGKLTGNEEDGAISLGKDGSVSLADLSGASNAEIQSVEIVAWEIKTIFTELNEKQIPFLQRLGGLQGGILDVSKPEEILSDTFSSARQDAAFVAGVKEEVGQFERGFEPPKVTDVAGANEALASSTTPEAAQETAKKEKALPVVEISSVDSWQGAGGWAYDRDSISYAAQLHADPVLKTWIEAAVGAANSSDPGLREDGLRVLNHTLDWKNGVESESTGGCLQCHSIDRNPVSTRLEVNWHEAYATTEQANRQPNLTRFSHGKHVVSLDCIHCHQAKEGGDYSDFFPLPGSEKTAVSGPAKFLPTSTDPGGFSPNFLPMNEMTLCASCHQENRAGNNCLQCHSYHDLNHQHVVRPQVPK